MSIEQHTGPDPHDGPAPTPAPADAGEALACLLHGLTTAVLALPADSHDADPRDDAGSPATDEAPAAPARERRTGSLLAELTFLDD